MTVAAEVLGLEALDSVDHGPVPHSRLRTAGFAQQAAHYEYAARCSFSILLLKEKGRCWNLFSFPSLKFHRCLLAIEDLFPRKWVHSKAPSGKFSLV